MEPSHVLVPLDRSPLDSAMSEGGVIEADASRETAAHDRADDLVADAKRRVEEAGQSVDTEVETGDPADTIPTYVDAHEVDHVVMGGHGGDRNALSRRLLGTVASTVVGKAPVTVTVVR